MSLMAAIDLAIRLQLAADRPDVGQKPTRILAGAAAAGGVAATGYVFDLNNVRKFLRGVSKRLKDDDPAIIYDWTVTDAALCLAANQETLIDLIMKNTMRASGKS